MRGGDIAIVISLLPKLSTPVSLLSHHAECSQRNQVGCQDATMPYISSNRVSHCTSTTAEP